MKIPLRFQITEFDCGTVALQNAISYLYDRENVPAELIRAVSIYTVNCYDERGNLSDSGNSKAITDSMTKWVDEFINKYGFGLSCKRRLTATVDYAEIKECVDNGGCCLVKTYRSGEPHFVIVTKIDEQFVYMWDAYYIGETYYDTERKITIIFNKPFHYNRQVDKTRFLATHTKDFSLGPMEYREVLLFNKR